MSDAQPEAFGHINKTTKTKKSGSLINSSFVKTCKSLWHPSTFLNYVLMHEVKWTYKVCEIFDCFYCQMPSPNLKLIRPTFGYSL